MIKTMGFYINTKCSLKPGEACAASAYVSNNVEYRARSFTIKNFWFFSTSNPLNFFIIYKLLLKMMKTRERKISFCIKMVLYITQRSCRDLAEILQRSIEIMHQSSKSHCVSWAKDAQKFAKKKICATNIVISWKPQFLAYSLK